MRQKRQKSKRVIATPQYKESNELPFSSGWSNVRIKDVVEASPGLPHEVTCTFATPGVLAVGPAPGDA
jgi:hypothetical protein